MLSQLAFWLHLRPLARRKRSRDRKSRSRDRKSCVLAFVSVAVIVLYLFK